MTRVNRLLNRNRLSDRDIVMDLLITQKYMSHFYDHAVLESSSPMIRDTFEAFQQDEHELGRVLFDVMQKRGWYGTSASGSTKSSSFSRSKRVRETSKEFDLSAASNYSIRAGSHRFGNRLSQSIAGD